MIFWIIVAILTLVICGIGFYPLFKKKANISETKRDSLNKAFYFDRLQEVEREANEGVIEDVEQTKLELQQSLLDDIPADEQALTPQHGVSKVWLIPILLAVGIISIGSYVSVGSWREASEINLTHKKLEYFYERIKNENTNPLNETELNQFAVALRTDLQENPNNAKGWFMLGQIGMAKSNGQLAYESYGKAVQLEPENLQYKSSYAQLLIQSNDPNDKSKGKKLLKELIRKDHTNLDALSMLAFSAFEEEDYQMAAATWGMMLRLIPKNEPRRVTVEKSIDMALSMLKEKEQQQKEADKDSQNGEKK